MILSRIQFGFTIGFHFIFPPLSIGLAWYLVFLEAARLRARARAAGSGAANAAGLEELDALTSLFARILALTFAVGVASGIVMSFQFGTNWAGFARAVNDIFGPFLVAEVLFAFFAESAFLGIYLLGGKRIPAWLHFLSILLLALAATVSAFWILTANSWMQTPAGYIMEGNRLASFGRAVFNPSMWIRFLHTIDSALIAGSFLIAGTLSYAVLRGKAGRWAARLLAICLIAGLVFSIAQIYPFGHSQAVEVGENQPVKLAAIEGAYQTQSRAPMTIFAIPTRDPPYVTARLQIPVLLSWLFDFKGDYVIRGLSDFPKDEYPPLAVTFVAFHLMFYLGIAFFVLTALAVVFKLAGRLSRARWLLWILVWAIPFPIACIQFGWITTEVGRQPWIVYGVLRTTDAVSPNVSGGQVLASLILFAAIYAGLLAAYLTLVVRTIRHGPEAAKGGV